MVMDPDRPEFKACASCVRFVPDLCESCAHNRKLIEDLQNQVMGFDTRLLVANERLEKQAAQLRGDAATSEKVARAFERLPSKEEEGS